MDLFAGRLPILKICATHTRAKLTGICADVKLLAHFLGQSGCFTDPDKEKFIAFSQALHNGAILDFWHQFLSRSMSADKQAQAVQYAEQILRLENTDRQQFKNLDFTPAIEKFCGIDLAYNALVYAERQINQMLALSAHNQLNPVFYPYLMGNKNPLLETDENQLKLNQMLLSQKIDPTDKVKKTITYWWQNTPAGIKYKSQYGDLQNDLGQTLIQNRHRVLGVVATRDDKIASRHPYRQRPTGRSGR